MATKILEISLSLALHSIPVPMWLFTWSKDRGSHRNYVTMKDVLILRDPEINADMGKRTAMLMQCSKYIFEHLKSLWCLKEFRLWGLASWFRDANTDVSLGTSVTCCLRWSVSNTHQHFHLHEFTLHIWSEISTLWVSFLVRFYQEKWNIQIYKLRPKYFSLTLKISNRAEY